MDRTYWVFVVFYNPERATVYPQCFFCIFSVFLQAALPSSNNIRMLMLFYCGNQTTFFLLEETCFVQLHGQVMNHGTL